MLLQKHTMLHCTKINYYVQYTHDIYWSVYRHGWFLFPVSRFASTLKDSIPIRYVYLFTKNIYNMKYSFTRIPMCKMCMDVLAAM